MHYIIFPSLWDYHVRFPNLKGPRAPSRNWRIDLSTFKTNKEMGVTSTFIPLSDNDIYLYLHHSQPSTNSSQTRFDHRQKELSCSPPKHCLTQPGQVRCRLFSGRKQKGIQIVHFFACWVIFLAFDAVC